MYCWKSISLELLLKLQLLQTESFFFLSPLFLFSPPPQFFSTLPPIGYDRPASSLITRPRTITLSQASEMSSLDSGVRTKPTPHSKLEKQLQQAQQDLHRLLEYAHVSNPRNYQQCPNLHALLIFFFHRWWWRRIMHLRTFYRVP